MNGPEAPQEQKDKHLNGMFNCPEQGATNLGGQHVMAPMQTFLLMERSRINDPQHPFFYSRIRVGNFEE